MNSTKIAQFLIITLGLSLFLTYSSRIAVAEVSIAYVDLQKAISMTKAGDKAKNSYEGKVKKAQTELDKKKSELERMRTQYSKQRASLSDSARSTREEKMISIEKDLKRTFEDSQESLRRENFKMVGDLVKKMRTVVTEVGEKEGYTIILEKGANSVLYADNDVDITDKVVAAFNSGKY